MPHANVISTGISSKRIGLDFWMEKALAEADRARGDWNPSVVHDLRVALRRCRTMAEALSEVNPAPGWRKLKKSSRALFHRLGELRDTQVAREWVKKLSLPNDPIRKHLLRILSRRDRQQRADAARVLDRFDRKAWRKMARKLPEKADFFPLESVVFQRLALASLNQAVELHRRASRGRSRIAWHRLRIAVKKFRYIVENFLPQRYQAWSEDLKLMQDLLGDVHDLDVLRVSVRRQCADLDPAVVAVWFEKIEAERKLRLDQFREKLHDKEFLWLGWRAGLQGGNSLQTISLIDFQDAYSAS
jgi:CHAD domain-containing protein